MRLGDMFDDLEAQPGLPGAAGTRERLIPNGGPCDLSVGVHKPDNTRSFRVRFSPGAVRPDPELPDFKGVTVRRYSGREGSTERVTFELRLISPVFNDVFTTLAEDFIHHLSEITDEKDAAAAFVRRLITWQRLLERHSPEGLDADEQRGVYGELWFMREHLFPPLTPLQVLQSWTGPERNAKDFQLLGCAVEVKTSTAKQHQHLQITSEKQLDDAGLAAMFLFHLSLESAAGAGETLPEMVQQIRQRAWPDASAAQLLEDKLRDAGYWDVHEHRYAAVGYVCREANLFRIQEGFPRLRERDLPSGVGDLRYSISVAECRHFPGDPEELLALITGGV